MRVHTCSDNCTYTRGERGVGLNIYIENSSATSDQWYDDTCKVIIWGTMSRTLPVFILYDTQDHHALQSIYSQVDPLCELEAWPTPLFILHVFKICLVPSSPRASPNQGAIYWNTIFSVCGSTCTMLTLFLLCSTRRTLIWRRCSFGIASILAEPIPFSRRWFHFCPVSLFSRCLKTVSLTS